jgi:hypothetical protein
MTVEDTIQIVLKAEAVKIAAAQLAELQTVEAKAVVIQRLEAYLRDPCNPTIQSAA